MENYNVKKIVFDGGGKSSIVITAGLHGNEQTSIRVAELVIHKLKSENVIGKVAIYPICNYSAFLKNERKASEDEKDLNRVFPGDKDGTYSQKLAAHIWNETKSYDYVLDLHCCGVYGGTYIMCGYSKYEFCKSLCPGLKISNVVHTKGTRGQFYIECCEQRNQKGLLIELPGGQPNGVVFKEVAEDTADKIINYLKFLKIVDGKYSVLNNVNYLSHISKLNKIEGNEYYKQIVKPGDNVKGGEILAEYNGNKIVAPFDCIVVYSAPDCYAVDNNIPVKIVSTKELNSENTNN